MRDLLSKVIAGSMIAGAALLVSACGGSEDATTNNANMIVEDPLMTNDVTAVDAMNGTDANLGVDANAGVDATVNTTTTDTTVTTNTTTTNGM